MGRRISELDLDGVTAIEKSANPKHYPNYCRLDIDPKLRDRLIIEEDGEFQSWYDNLGMNCNIIFDLHDNRKPAFLRKFVNKEAKSLGLGYVMKDGYVAVRDREMAYADVHYRCYSNNIDDVLRTFEAGWNKEHKWRHVEFNKYEKPLFLKPSADIEMTVEFMPVRIIGSRPKNVRRIRTSTGVSLITQLIETLRPL